MIEILKDSLSVKINPQIRCFRGILNIIDSMKTSRAVWLHIKCKLALVVNIPPIAVYYQG
jgi:hypothetical protein